MSFDLQPTLTGELVELRPLQLEDFSDLYSVASDPLIWEQHPARDRCEHDVFQQFFRESLESGGALIAIDREHGRVIGSSRFHGYDQDGSEIEIGWTFLARSHWGGRYNKEMKQLMLGHAFRFVERVVFLVDPGNLRSQRAVVKIGAARSGSRPDAGGREKFVYEITALTFSKAGRLPKNTICLWFDKDAQDAARFYAATFPDSEVTAVHKAPSDYPAGKAGDVLIVEFTVLGIPCLGLNGGPQVKHSDAFSFQIATDNQEETDRYWNAIVGNGGKESQCGWCKDRWGLSWQITPRALTEALAAGGGEAKRVFEAMMPMKKIDIATIEAARRG